MHKLDILERIGLIPITKFESLEHVTHTVQALLQAHLPIIEITFRSPCAPQALNLVAHQFPQVILCAGTILTIDDINCAIDHGAQYLFSPGFNPKTVEYALKKNIHLIPGVSNPSLIQQAMDMGLTTLKFFPSENMGGVATLKTLSEIYPNIKFIPTGGINETNLSHYTKLNNIHAIGGGWITNPKLIHEKKFSTITKIAKNSLLMLHDFQLEYSKKSKNNPNKLLELLQCITKEISQKTENDLVQILTINVQKCPKMSKIRHDNDNNFLILHCNHLERAQFYFENQGFIFESLFDFQNKKIQRIIQFSDPLEGVVCYVTDL